MQFLLRELRSKIRYKIILPFLVLTLLVALAGSFVALGLAASNQQDKFNNLVAEVTRTINDSIVEQEVAYLEHLREITFAPNNPQTGAPAPADAVADRDIAGLRQAVIPYFATGMRETGLRIDRLIAFDRNGLALVDIGRYPLDATTTFTDYARLDYSNSPVVSRVLQADTDNIGDKFARLMNIPTQLASQPEPPDSTLASANYFATIVPIHRDNDSAKEVIGGMILAQRLDNMVEQLANRSRATIVVVYDDQGRAIASSTTPDAAALGPSSEQAGLAQRVDMSSLTMRQPVLSQLRAGQVPADQSVFDLMTVNQREYQFAITPLRIRQVTMGYVGGGLSRDYVLSTLSDIQGYISVLTVVLMVAIVGLGAYVARQITMPLEELVVVAKSVTAGDLRRRSEVHTRDELGELSQSFNTMTESLVHLYNRVLAESSQLAAIVESIADGIIVCDRSGTIQLINPAVRKLLKQTGSDSIPTRFSDLPLGNFEGQAFGPDVAANLYTIGDRIVRLSQAPILAKGRNLGDVYVLQDMTDEVNVSRAKTNFIGTISHELRTPITILRGTADLMLRGMFGRLEERQATEVINMQRQLLNMTRLINNVIVIADIDSGALPFDMEPLDVQETIEDAVWKMQAAVKEKGLTLSVDIPDDLPPVMADYDHFHTIMQQLVDNARRYTEEGGITITAARAGQFVQINVIDTGFGIEPAMQEQVFDRFVRGTGKGQGIDSQERGIGLGLAIVKQLVERHGGTIWVTSEIDQGSIFSFTLKQADVMGTPEEQDRAFGTAA